MKAVSPNPILVPLAGILKARGIKLLYDCELNRMGDSTRPEHPPMKELTVTVPLLAIHRIDGARRMAVGIGDSLMAWRERLRIRGINLLLASRDGLLSNAAGLADEVCQHIYRVSIEDLREYAAAGMPPQAIHAFTGIPVDEIPGMIRKFYGKTMAELQDDANG